MTTTQTVKSEGKSVPLQGTLPASGTIFPEYCLIASDDRAVDADAFAGKKKVYFLCEGPEHEATAAFVVNAAAAVEAVDDTVLVPIARTPPVEWRRFLRGYNLSGIAPLSIGVDVAVPFPVVQAGVSQGQLCPALVYVDESDEVYASQLAVDADTLDGLDVAVLLQAKRSPRV
jgi:peroxiredoxin